MDADRFWTLVDDAHRAAGANIEARILTLSEQLSPLSAAELQSFQNHYDDQMCRAYRWDLCAAAKIMEGRVSDDSFRYFRDWLISEGRTSFEAAMNNPDTLADRAPIDIPSLEEFGYVALSRFREKGEGELKRDFSTEGADPAGEDWQEENLPELLPRLWAKYNQREE